MAKRLNRTDLTLRNLQAMKKTLARHDLRLRVLETQLHVVLLGRRRRRA